MKSSERARSLKLIACAALLVAFGVGLYAAWSGSRLACVFALLWGGAAVAYHRVAVQWEQIE